MPSAPPPSPEEFLSQVARESWDLFKDNAFLMVVTSLLVILGSMLSLGILAGPLAIGFIELIRRRRRQEPAGVGDLFRFEHFAGGLVAVVLLVILLGLGFLLLVVPGILLSILTVFTLPAIAYEGLTAVDAIKRSMQLVRRNFVHVLLLSIGLSVLNAVAGAVVLATLVAAPLSFIAMTVAYELLASPDAAPAPDDPAAAQFPA